MIATRLTARLGIRHPVLSAPMAVAAGGALAGAVTAAGGLGLIGGGYGDPGWLAAQFDAAGNQPVGCGFLTWSLRDQPELLEQALQRRPRAIFLSFDDPEPFATRVRAAGLPLICQVQTLRDAARAIEVGATVIVAQGAEAGGHGERRATFTLVPEVADLIAARAPDTLLCAAGGVVDGRGLAAARLLGAAGGVAGTRFWATREALVHPNMHDAALAADGDATVRSTVMDIVRGLAWPGRFTARVLRNDFIERWHGREDGLRTSLAEEGPRWRRAWAEGDIKNTSVFVGEGVGLVHAVEAAGIVLERMVAEAQTLLRERPPAVLT